MQIGQEKKWAEKKIGLKKKFWHKKKFELKTLFGPAKKIGGEFFFWPNFVLAQNFMKLLIILQ